jgi:hypothetical protein
MGGFHKEKFEHYSSNALSSYKEWGATAKIAQLKAKHKKATPNSKGIQKQMSL